MRAKLPTHCKGDNENYIDENGFYEKRVVQDPVGRFVFCPGRANERHRRMENRGRKNAEASRGKRDKCCMNRRGSICFSLKFLTGYIRVACADGIVDPSAQTAMRHRANKKPFTLSYERRASCVPI